MKKLTLFLGIFMLSSLLSACAGIFMPQHKTIEYDEEVKLHDGSMIWVHIKRHYHLTGGAIGDPGWGEPSYMPGAVEISWDTGFKGVGRKSVVFKGQVYVIDKIDNKWYVYGSTIANLTGINNSIPCNDVGTLYFNNSNCLVKVDSLGEFVKPNGDSLKKLKKGNILYSYSIKDWGLVPLPLNGKKMTWHEKLLLQNTQPKKDRNVDITLFLGE